jgi:hypothetical protein
MTPEILSMLGGGIMGFLFRFLAQQQEAQTKALEMSMQLQDAADASADRAGARSGSWVRRVLSLTVLFGLIGAPLVLAFVGLPTYVESDQAGWDLLGLFTGGWTRVEGYLILPEVRTAMLAVVAFYLGSSQVGRT